MYNSQITLIDLVMTSVAIALAFTIATIADRLLELY